MHPWRKGTAPTAATGCGRMTGSVPVVVSRCMKHTVPTSEAEVPVPPLPTPEPTTTPEQRRPPTEERVGIFRRIWRLGETTLFFLFLAALFGFAAILGIIVGIHDSGSMFVLVAVLLLIAGIAYTSPSARRTRQARRAVVRPVHSRTIPQDVKIAVSVRDGGKCRICGSQENLQYDHILPYSLGGRSEDVDNIQLLCGCHKRLKSNRYVG